MTIYIQEYKTHVAISAGVYYLLYTQLWKHSYHLLISNNSVSPLDHEPSFQALWSKSCGPPTRSLQSWYLRTNRKGFSTALKHPATKGFKERGESKTYQRSNLTVSVWQDNWPVVAIATNADPTTTGNVLRKNKDGSKESYPCPTSIVQYNKYMGGIDHNNQLRGYYHVRPKCLKYYKYIFWFLFDPAITNSYILYRLHTDLQMDSLKSFLAKELIYNYSSIISHPSALPPSRRFCQSHFPMRGADKVHRCHYCATGTNDMKESDSVLIVGYFSVTPANLMTASCCITRSMGQPVVNDNHTYQPQLHMYLAYD